MIFEDLTPDQKERARNAKSPEEVLKLAKEAGYELSDEELKDISGGTWYTTAKDLDNITPCLGHTVSGLGG